MTTTLSRVNLVKTLQLGRSLGKQNGRRIIQRTAVTKSTGALLPEPQRDPLGLLGFSGTVLVGLTLGATISKHIASFLEENELFVPADDDDDD